MKTNLSKTTDSLLQAPPILWAPLYSEKVNPGNAEFIRRELDALIEKAAMLRGYVASRYDQGGGDEGHAKAVKNANRLCTKMRRALGYTYAEQPISF